MMHWIDKTVRVVVSSMITVFTVVILVSIFFRYVLNNSLVWSEQVCRYLYVWMVMLGMPVVYRAKGNVAFDLLYNRFSPRIKRLFHVITDLLIACFSGFLALQGLKYTILKGSTIITGINLPQGYLYVSQPIGGVILILFVIEHIISTMKISDDKVEEG
jgi:TRAP-type C4-dicarboxylate transport system permease small subunit